jgi:ABC-type multidrug transport system ATPase subunit
MMPAQAGPAVEAEDLARVYPGGKTALGGVSFAVGRGEIFGFLGPNGSGKTTTVRILVTLLRATRGAARVAGFDTAREAHRVRRVIGYAGQSVGVDDDLIASENLAVTGFIHGLRHDESWRRAAELLEVFSLADAGNVRAGRLSGGLRRRLDLAQARWCTGRRCCSSTSPRPGSTRCPATHYGTSCAAAAGTGRRCS